MPLNQTLGLEPFLPLWAVSLGMVEPGPVVSTQHWTRRKASAKTTEVEVCGEVPPGSWDVGGTCGKVLRGSEEFLLEPRLWPGGLWDRRPFHSHSHSIDIVGLWGGGGAPHYQNRKEGVQSGGAGAQVLRGDW